MQSIIKQIIKFGFVGVLCFIIDYGLMIFFTEVLNVNYLVSCAISFSVSVTVNYLLSMAIVFVPKKDSNKMREFVIFVALSVVGLGINQVIMWFSVEKLSIYYMISKIGATIIVMIYNFITRKLILEEKNN